MNSSFRRSSTSFTILMGLALLWAAALACFPGEPTSSPSVQEPAAREGIAQTTEAAPAPTARPTAASTPPVPTHAPASAAVTDSPAQSATVSTEADATATPVPGPAETAETPASISAIFDGKEDLEKLAFHYLSELAEDVGPRTSGTDLERKASEFLLEEFDNLGYEAGAQEFTWDSPAASLTIDLPDSQDLEANILSGTANGDASAQLALVGLGKPDDVPEEGLEGKIALVERGEITFGSKVAEVHNAGAVGAIIFNNVPGSFRGTLGGQSQIPAISLSQADGRHLKELLDQGETIEAAISIEDNAVPSRNVIAELPGTGDGIIVVGAHYDTVPDSIGASDNSSGMGALLAVAEQLAGRSFPFTLRFIAFGSEETGLHGSEYYVDSLTGDELEEIYLMVNMDSVGSGTRLRLFGDRWAAKHVEETADREGIPLDTGSRRGSGGSDHVNFRNAWVPIIYFLADDLSRINTPADTMEHINPDLLGNVTALVLDLLENAADLPGYGQ